MENRNVLVIRPRFLGDVVLATGLAGKIKKASPGARVTYLVESHFADLLSHHPDIDGTIPFSAKSKNNPLYLYGFFKDLRSRKFDTVLDLFGNPRTAQMSFLSGAETRVGFKLRGRSWAYTSLAPPSSPALPSGRRPVTEAYLDQVRALGLDSSGPYWTSLAVTEDERSQALDFFKRAEVTKGERVVVLSAGASWPAKHWPLGRFLELAAELSRLGARPLFLLGPKESDLASGIQAGLPPGGILVQHQKPSIRDMMALIAAADALVSNDTGPMHVGPALGTPTVGIFGPGEPEIWFPYGGLHRAMYHEVPCGHCGLDHCPLMACMDHIQVADVLKATLQVLQKN